MSREEKIWSLATIVVVGFWLAVAFHYTMGAYARHPYPQNTFLFRPVDAGNDFHNIFAAVDIGDPYSSPLSVYFPFTYFPLFLLTPFSSSVALAILLILFTSTIGVLMWRSLSVLPRPQRALPMFALTLCTYPYLFCVDRGNVEMLVFIFLAGFFALLDRHAYWAAALLGAAAAMKGYPAMFGLLFLARRQVKPFVVSLATVAVLSLGSAVLLPTGLGGTLERLQANLAGFNRMYVARADGVHLNGDGMHFNASYLGLARVLELLRFLPMSLVVGFERAYVAFAAVVGLLIAWWVVLVDQVIWRQAALITVAVLVLPHVSFDYKLVLLLLPIALFLMSEHRSRFDRGYVWLLGLLMVPKAYGWVAGEISVSVILTPLLLTVLAAVVVADRVTSRNAAAPS